MIRRATLKPGRKAKSADPFGLAESRKKKYRNVPVMVDGVRFDSKAELARWNQLKMLERAGEIKDLQRQVRFELCVNGLHICDYIADFTYQDRASDPGRWRFVVEDVKGGIITADARIKMRLMYVLQGIDVKIVRVSP